MERVAFYRDKWRRPLAYLEAVPKVYTCFQGNISIFSNAGTSKILKVAAKKAMRLGSISSRKAWRSMPPLMEGVAAGNLLKRSSGLEGLYYSSSRIAFTSFSSPLGTQARI